MLDFEFDIEVNLNNLNLIPKLSLLLESFSIYIYLKYSNLSYFEKIHILLSTCKRQYISEILTHGINKYFILADKF